VLRHLLFNNSHLSLSSLFTYQLFVLLLPFSLFRLQAPPIFVTPIQPISLQQQRMALFCIGLVAFLAVIPAFSAQECPVDSSCIVPPPSLGSAPPRIVPPKTTNGFFDWWYTLPYLISRSLPTSSLPQGMMMDIGVVVSMALYVVTVQMASIRIW
jgi:hypothetical protein